MQAIIGLDSLDESEVNMTTGAVHIKHANENFVNEDISPSVTTN